MINVEKYVAKVMPTVFGIPARPDFEVDTTNKLPVLLYKVLDSSEVRNRDDNGWIISLVFTLVHDEPVKANELAYELYECIKNLPDVPRIPDLGWVSKSFVHVPVRSSAAKIAGKTHVQYTLTARLSCRTH